MLEIISTDRTIGDAYICATNLMEKDDDGVHDAAIRALAMAKDMIIESTNVKIPESWANLDSVQIRVGIHVGNVTSMFQICMHTFRL